MKNVTCPIDNATTDPYGAFANAIRLSADGLEVLLDFCVYSEIENRARVVSRVRVSREFLHIIQNKIGLAISPPKEGEFQDLLVMPPIKEET